MAGEIGFLEFMQNLPPEIVNSARTLITILTAAGILFIIYLVFLIISWIMNFLRNKRIKKIYDKVNELDEKVNFLVECQKQKDIKEEKNKGHFHNKVKRK